MLLLFVIPSRPRFDAYELRPSSPKPQFTLVGTLHMQKARWQSMDFICLGSLLLVFLGQGPDEFSKVIAWDVLQDTWVSWRCSDDVRTDAVRERSTQLNSLVFIICYTFKARHV
jgi:hypothetical protein